MKRLITLAVSILLASFSAFSQVKQGEVYSYVEQMPEPGFSITEYMSANLSYPADAQAAKIEGKVVLKFIVNEEGGLDSIRVIRPLYPSIDSTAISLIQKMPKWKPAMQSGKAVKAYYTLPVFFKLQEVIRDTLDSQPEPLFDFWTYLDKNLQYPQKIDTSMSSSGDVILQFVINPDSTISDIKIIQSLQPAFDIEAERVVKGMPKWKPGIMNKTAVPTLYTLPIHFSTRVSARMDEIPEPGYNLAEYIYANAQTPPTLVNARKHVRVIVKFTINEDGTISDVHMPTPYSRDIDSEAIRVISNMPKWKKPGKHKGKTVKVNYTIPLLFNGSRVVSYY